MEEQLSRESW